MEGKHSTNLIYVAKFSVLLESKTALRQLRGGRKGGETTLKIAGNFYMYNVELFS